MAFVQTCVVYFPQFIYQINLSDTVFTSLSGSDIMAPLTVAIDLQLNLWSVQSLLRCQSSHYNLHNSCSQTTNTYRFYQRMTEVFHLQRNLSLPLMYCNVMTHVCSLCIQCINKYIGPRAERMLVDCISSQLNLSGNSPVCTVCMYVQYGHLTQP